MKLLLFDCRYNQDDSEIGNTFKDASEYRKEVIAKLVQFTNIFVSSLLENVYSFPKCVSWIVYNVSKIIEKSYGSKEVILQKYFYVIL